MPALITVAQLKEHIETDLASTALQRYIDDADAEIARHFGPHSGNIVERFDVGRTIPPGDFPPYTYPLAGWIGPEGWSDTQIFTGRPVGAVVSVSETVNGVVTVLHPTDYELGLGGLVIKRLGTGVNKSWTWRGRVIVTYTSVDEAARRTRVEVDLCKLAISYDTLKSEKVGDYMTVRYDDYQLERENILSALAPAFSIA